MESRKRVYSEAFGGEWTQSEYHEVDDNSDDGWDDTGWCTGIVVKTGYSWEWKFDDLIACEAEIQNERDIKEMSKTPFGNHALDATVNQLLLGISRQRHWPFSNSMESIREPVMQ